MPSLRLVRDARRRPANRTLRISDFGRTWQRTTPTPESNQPQTILDLSKPAYNPLVSMYDYSPVCSFVLWYMRVDAGETNPARVFHPCVRE